MTNDAYNKVKKVKLTLAKRGKKYHINTIIQITKKKISNTFLLSN